MAKLQHDRVAFEAIWSGKNDGKGNKVVFKLEISAMEQAASLLLQSWAEYDLTMKIKVEGELVNIGPCKYWAVTARGGTADSTVSFLTNLADWGATKEQQMMFDERLLAVAVINSSIQQEEEEEKDDNE